MAVISTSVFLPVEFYDVLRQISVVHVTMLLSMSPSWGIWSRNWSDGRCGKTEASFQVDASPGDRPGECLAADLLEGGTKESNREETS